MRGLQVMAGFTLYPDRALVEITGKVFNGNDTPRHFLWWANPAVKGGDDHQSVFPPDVTAVFDHGKRDVSAFPIATGTYYKVDYSAGVDISRYRNVPVPTSYMAEKSDYDFVGARITVSEAVYYTSRTTIFLRVKAVDVGARRIWSGTGSSVNR